MDRRTFLKIFLSSSVSATLMLSPEIAIAGDTPINRYRIPVPGLPKSFDGFTIAHLTDLHYGVLESTSYVREVVQKVNSVESDIVACTGDYVQRRHTTAEIDAVWPEMCRLRAKEGVYSVLGNHDHWANSERSQQWLEKSGQSLHHSVHKLTRNGESLWLVGSGDLFEDYKHLDIIMKDIPEGDCRIVLAHNPDTADMNFQGRVDLMICGHTHGGQINIPFLSQPWLPIKNHNYNFGLKLSKRGFPMFISRGIGWSIVPIRLNCPPEIAVLELTAA
jgi:predicted MPP superfamily phosphohydrolase